MAHIRITKSIATWNIMYVSTSGKSDVLANFSDGPLQRAMVCSAAVEAADLKAVDEIQLDMCMQEMELLRLYNRNGRMEDVLAKGIDAMKAALEAELDAAFA